jgi:hypothetical protein
MKMLRMILLTIYRGFLDDSNTLIADPFLLYKGNIESFEIQENEKDKCSWFIYCISLGRF